MAWQNNSTATIMRRYRLSSGAISAAASPHAKFYDATNVKFSSMAWDRGSRTVQSFLGRFIFIWAATKLIERR